MINLTLQRYLEILWGYRDKAVLGAKENKEELDQLRAHANEAVFHLQETEHEGRKMVVVWRAQDWAIDIARYTLQKAESDKRMRMVDAKRECVEYLVPLVAEFMSLERDSPMAKSIATEIVEKEKTQMALFYQAKPERLPWVS